MFASCGDVEFDGGNLSAGGAVAVRSLAEDASVACCRLTASGRGVFLGRPLFLGTTGGAAFGVMLDGVGGIGGVEGAWSAAPFIHDFICFLPSAWCSVLAVAFALWASLDALERAPAVMFPQQGRSRDEKRCGGYASVAAWTGERDAGPRYRDECGECMSCQRGLDSGVWA